MTRKLSIVLAFAASLFQASAQADKNATAPRTLPELAVEAKPVKELNWGGSAPIDGSQVENRGISSISDLSGIAPNFHVNANSIQSYGDIITMRGIANTQLFGAPGVQLYVDGVPQADVSSYGSNLYDVESIEVLRGPQGYHFGKSVTGGAINIKTKSPGKEHTNKLSASYGTFNSQKYNLGSKGPLTEGFSYSIDLHRAMSDGFLNNSSGRDNTSETWHGALKFYYDKGNGTKATFGANFETHELGAQPLVKRNPSDFYARSTNFDEFTEIDRNQQFLTLESELGESRLISITNRNDWSMNPNRVDLDMSINPASDVSSVILQDQIEWSQELRLESVDSSDLNWVVGLFYSDSETNGLATRQAPPSFLDETTDYTLESQNIGIFSSVGKQLTEHDFISLGLRYDSYDKSMKRSKTSSFVPLPPGIPDANPSQDFRTFSPSIQWNRTLGEYMEGIARITYSEKPGGFSAYSNNDAQLAFSEEQTMAYEVSVLIDPNDFWGLNLTAFINEVEKYQFELPDRNDPLRSDYYVDNADQVTAQGLEIEGFIKPSDSFTFSVAYGICDAEYDKFASLPGLVGKQVSFIPEHTLACSLNYQLPNGFYGQIGTKTIGETYFWVQEGSNSEDKIESYTLLDANLGFEYESWKFNLFGLNLTDEQYYTSLVSNLKSFTTTDGINPGPAPGIVGSPRVIGLSISKEF